MTNRLLALVSLACAVAAVWCLRQAVRAYDDTRDSDGWLHTTEPELDTPTTREHREGEA